MTIKAEIDLIRIWKKSPQYTDWYYNDHDPRSGHECFWEWKKELCIKNNCVDPTEFHQPLNELWFNTEKDKLVYELRGLKLDE